MHLHFDVLEHLPMMMSPSQVLTVWIAMTSNVARDHVLLTISCARERRLMTGSRPGKFDTTRRQSVCLSNPRFRLVQHLLTSVV
jgi:hypothetical protein